MIVFLDHKRLALSRFSKVVCYANIFEKVILNKMLSGP